MVDSAVVDIMVVVAASAAAAVTTAGFLTMVAAVTVAAMHQPIIINIAIILTIATIILT